MCGCSFYPFIAQETPTDIGYGWLRSINLCDPFAIANAPTFFVTDHVFPSHEILSHTHTNDDKYTNLLLPF